LSNINKNIFKDAIAVSGIGILTQIIGFMVPMLIAMKFGVNIFTDAYYLAIAIPVLFVQIIVGGCIRLVFIPVFIDEQVRDHNSRDDIVGGFVMLLLGFSVILMLLVSILIKIGMFSFVADLETEQLAASFTLYLLPLIPLSLLSNLYMAVYQAQQKFARAAYTRMIRLTVEVIAIVLLVEKIGIYSIIIGQLIGQTLELLTMGWLVKHYIGISLTPKFIIPEGIQKILKLSGFAFGGFAVVSMIPFCARMISSMLPEGNVTIMGYARKLALIPNLIISGSIGTVLTSYWANELAHKRPKIIKESLTRVISGIFMLIVPMAIGLYVLRLPIVKLLFERGEFDVMNSLATSIIFSIFVIGAVPTYLHMVIVRILHVQKAMRILFWISAAGVSVNIILMYFLGISLNFGLYGIAWAMSIGTTFTMLITAASVEHLYNIFEFKKILFQALKVVVSTIIMVVCVNFFMMNLVDPETFGLFTFLICASIFGALIYGAILILLKHSELIKMIKLLKTKFIR